MPSFYTLIGAVRSAAARSARTAARVARAIVRPFTRLTLLHLSWIHAKVALGVWAVLFLVFTPDRVADSWGGVISWLVAGVTLSGVVLSVIGLIASAPEKGAVLPSRRTLTGLLIELVGLWWMLLGGLLAYTLTQFALTFDERGDQRIALTAFAYASCAFALCRIAMVSHRRRKERRVAEVKVAA